MEQQKVFSTHIPEKTIALRDFFSAWNSSLIAKAYNLLSMATPQSAPRVNDWGKIEFAFNRLFVGPGPVIAPPYASIYIDGERFVMGETTLKVRQFYKLIGQRSNIEGNIPEDHISLELDACIYMRERLKESYSNQIDALYQSFLCKHLTKWIPKFVTKVNQANSVPDPILWICSQLSTWLNCENEHFCRKKDTDRSI